MSTTSHATRRDGDWALPIALTVALGIGFAFAPFAGESIDDVQFWLVGFGFLWLVSSAVLVIREGPPMRPIPKAVAYHVASAAAMLPHLLVGALVLAVVSRVAVALAPDPTRALESADGLLVIGALFAAWLRATAWGLSSWLQRSWKTLLVPVVSVSGLIATTLMSLATFGMGQH
jgi:hypothetical protein